MIRDALPWSLLVALLLVAAPTSSGADSEKSEPLRGIDVSHDSGDVDWPTVVKAGYDFVFLKATEGVDNPDPRFPEHWNTLKKHGLLRGAYHFYVTEDDPEEQAHFFLSTVRFEEGDLAPVVDIELIGHDTKPGVAKRLRRFLEIVEKEVGVRPIIYTMPNFWNEHLGGGFEDYPLWVAEYGVESPRLPKAWAEWHIWQHESDATIPGVEKGADLNLVRPGFDLGALVVNGGKADRSPD